ncbi:MAG TPA: hypothetical protein VN025_03695 [Candidatus Dormibacteraeota bacterium]|nr:hypothetical protein [Candidatus Dormibacteraeota bacterium]
MEKGISLEVIWSDEHMFEVLFSCSNGFFSGRAEMYLDDETPSKFAGALQGFPTSPSDTREFEMGTFNPQHADGGVRMRFYCTDSSGHAMVDVKLRGDASLGLGEVQSVALQVPIEAASVDEFIRQLKGMEKSIGASASLRFAGNTISG